MGRFKIDLNKKIEGKKARQDVFYKRKFGVLRKIIQMQKLCECNILLFVYDDEKKHLYEYRSDPSFDITQAQSLIEK